MDKGLSIHINVDLFSNANSSCQHHRNEPDRSHDSSVTNTFETGTSEFQFPKNRELGQKDFRSCTEVCRPIAAAAVKSVCTFLLLHIKNC